MRIAIFHDFFPAIGGGERTVLALARAWRAPVYTTDIHRPSIERLGYGDVNLISLGDIIPQAPLRQIHASIRFALANVDADVYVLSGNWPIYAARRHHPNLEYCYTPARGFYDLRDAIIRRQPTMVHRAGVWSWSALHGAADRVAWTNVDRVVAISENIRRRIKTFLGRDSSVVYPPTDVARYRFETVGDFWLSVNRLYPEKRLEIQYEAFRRLPNERLVVVGGYAHADHAEKYFRRLHPPPNVEFRGEIDERELIHLYAQCRGLVCTAIDEDFGLTPVEAMASGKCVLATNEGGYRETIREGRTGFLLPPDAEAFAAKIRSLGDDLLRSMKDDCLDRARAFDESIFVEKMRGLIEGAPSHSAGPVHPEVADTVKG